MTRRPASAHAFLPPRQLVIYAVTRRMLDSSALCIRKFAMAVAEVYFAQTAIDQRHVKFRWGEDLDALCKAERHNAQVLSRYMDGTVKVLPADLEDAWVTALPPPYRGELERQLAIRRGLLAVAIPEPQAAVLIDAVPAMTCHFGELLAAAAPVWADGRLAEDDRPHLQRLVGEAEDLLAAVSAVRLRALELLAKPQERRTRDQ